MKDERLYLGHIREAINDAKAYAALDEPGFITDRMRQDAIIRKLEVIDEAVKQLSEPTRSRRAEIPWKQVAGMRDGAARHHGRRLHAKAISVDRIESNPYRQVRSLGS